MGADWSQDAHVGNHSELRYSYHVVCNEFYHGEACSDYCRPRNDTFGHFHCDGEGRRVCQEGWSGEYCSDRESFSLAPHAPRKTAVRFEAVGPSSSAPPLLLLCCSSAAPLLCLRLCVFVCVSVCV